MSPFLPRPFGKGEQVWGKAEEQLEVGDVEKVEKEAQVKSRTHSNSESPWLLYSLALKSWSNHCKVPFLQLHSGNVKSGLVALWCELNQAMLTKHLTLCLPQTEDKNTVVLVQSLTLVKKRRPDKGAGSQWAGGPRSEQQERDSEDGDSVHGLCDYSKACCVFIPSFLNSFSQFTIYFL